jgi:hypothetical protein
VLETFGGVSEERHLPRLIQTQCERLHQKITITNHRAVSVDGIVRSRSAERVA